MATCWGYEMFILLGLLVGGVLGLLGDQWGPGTGCGTCLGLVPGLVWGCGHPIPGLAQHRSQDQFVSGLVSGPMALRLGIHVLSVSGVSLGATNHEDSVHVIPVASHAGPQQEAGTGTGSADLGGSSISHFLSSCTLSLFGAGPFFSGEQKVRTAFEPSSQEMSNRGHWGTLWWTSKIGGHPIKIHGHMNMGKPAGNPRFCA